MLYPSIPVNIATYYFNYVTISFDFRPRVLPVVRHRGRTRWDFAGFARISAHGEKSGSEVFRRTRPGDLCHHDRRPRGSPCPSADPVRQTADVSRPLLTSSHRNSSDRYGIRIRKRQKQPISVATRNSTFVIRVAHQSRN